SVALAGRRCAVAAARTPWDVTPRRGPKYVGHGLPFAASRYTSTRTQTSLGGKAQAGHTPTLASVTTTGASPKIGFAVAAADALALVIVPGVSGSSNSRAIVPAIAPASAAF